MPGGGSILAMIQSLRNNKNLLRKRGLFNRARSIYDRRKEYYRAGKAKLDFKTVSKKELLIIRKRIIKQRKLDALKNWIIAISIGLVFGFGTYKSIAYYQKNKSGTEIVKEIDLREKLRNYYFFISDGDLWIKKRHWDNAIFQYKKALELFPDDYSTLYKLALAYNYNCSNENEDCDSGLKLTKRLLIYMPNDSALIEIKKVFESK
jgi:tetratricopeptide (TPR) repeat protein